MTQSQPLRSASLCHRYWSSAPTTWSITQPQSRSDHVPGKTTTPNFNWQSPPVEAIGGSPRNRRFRGVQTRLRRTSSTNDLVDFEVEVLDDVIGEQLPAHRL